MQKFKVSQYYFTFACTISYSTIAFELSGKVEWGSVLLVIYENSHETS
jgi:hypothetical protein